MAAISFPSNPSNGDEHIANGRTWVFYSSVPGWRAKADMAVPPALDDEWVAHGHAQSLTDEAKRRAQANIGVAKSNLTATAAPGASNDVTEGYSVLSLWADVMADLAYVCLDATEDAAVWRKLTITPAELTALVASKADVPVTRSTAQGRPEPIRLQVSGSITTQVAGTIIPPISVVLAPVLAAGRPYFTNDYATAGGLGATSSFIVWNAGGYWRLRYNAVGDQAEWRAAVDVAHPLLVDPGDWVPYTGGNTSGTPGVAAVTVAGINYSLVEPAYPGQLCRVGDAAPYEWHIAESGDPLHWRLLDPTASTILTLLQGALADPTRIGAEYIPDSLTRTLAQGTPNNPESIEVAGIGMEAGLPVTDPVLTRPGGLINDRAYWQATLGGKLARMAYDGDEWLFTVDAVVYARKATLQDVPVGLTDWTLQNGAVTDPVVSADTPITQGSFIGQYCRVGDVPGPPFVWYRWNGEEWDGTTDLEAMIAFLETNAAQIRTSLDLDSLYLKQASNLADLGNPAVARGNLHVTKDSYTMVGKSITSDVPLSDEPADQLCQTVRLGSTWTGSMPNGYALPTLANMLGKRPITYTNATGGAMSFYDPGDLGTPLFTIEDTRSVTVWHNKRGVWQWVVEAAIVQDGLIYDAGTASGNIQLDRTNGLYQKVQIGASNPTPVFLPPMNGSTNETITARVKAHGADASTLAFDAAILVPSDYAGELPKPLGLGLTYKIKLEYNGTAWELQALVGGYA